jgi:hypothetical protein
VPAQLRSIECRLAILVVCGLAAGLVVIAAGAAVAAHAAVECDSTEVQPFLPWYDPASYVLAPGGSMEPGANSWTLSGGAAIVAGNEPFRVHSPTDNHSVMLPSGSSALTSMVCLELTYPTLRFFAVNTSSPSATLDIVVYFRSGAGALLGSATVASLYATNSWAPTLPIPVLANGAAPTGTQYVQFRFVPVGQDSGWRIDDVYVDPWSSR